MQMQDISVVKREVEGHLVPYGELVTLLPGQEVLVTQALGGSFTLNVNGNLIRIKAEDADAIGKEIPDDISNRSNNKSEKEIDLVSDLDKELVWDQIRTCYDPEIPVNIVDLGLIYKVELKRREKEGGYHIAIEMTLTAPGCGMGPVIVQDVENAVMSIPQVYKVDVVLVFDPPWDSEMMTEEARLELGML